MALVTARGPDAIKEKIKDGYDYSLKKARGDLVRAQALKRVAIPVRKQLEGAVAFKARMPKQLQEARATHREREDEHNQAQARLEAQQKVV